MRKIVIIILLLFVDERNEVVNKCDIEISVVKVTNIFTFAKAIDFIKEQETFHKKCIWDFKRYSNGYGTKALYRGEFITKDIAHKRMVKHLLEAWKIAYEYNLSTSKTNILTCFIYNVGKPKYNLNNALLSNDNCEITNWMSMYNKAGGEIRDHLVARRDKEILLWIKYKKDEERRKDKGGE